jgi:hypothetical protein
MQKISRDGTSVRRILKEGVGNSKKKKKKKEKQFIKPLPSE